MKSLIATKTNMTQIFDETGKVTAVTGLTIRPEDAAVLSEGDEVQVTGTSKGKGFQGVIKRHNYAGGPASHGSMFYRAPGSIGASSYPSRVWKNKGLPGHMGDERVTVKNLRVVDVKAEQNLLLILGAVPGSKGTYLEIRKES